MRIRSILAFIIAFVTSLSFILQTSCAKVTLKEIDAPTGIVVDVDNNIYKTINIGSQWWMAENLKTTRYHNKSSIPLDTVNSWANLSDPAYCWYKNDTGYKNLYGALYNWYTVKNGNLCPEGWHVPSDNDWTILSEYLGGPGLAGGKLKDTIHWGYPNEGATNVSGFTAVGSGLRYDNGNFDEIGELGLWWSASEIDDNYAISRTLSQRSTILYVGKKYKQSGLSVRCVKD